MNLNSTSNAQFAVEEHALIRKRNPSESLGLRLHSSNATASCVILAITPGSPADRCGILQPNDIIVGVNGVSVEGLNHGGVIQALKRGGKSFTLTVTRPTVLATPSDDYMTDPTTTTPTASSTDGHVHDDTQSANIIKSIPDVTMHQSVSPQDMAARVIHHIFAVLVPAELGLDMSLSSIVLLPPAIITPDRPATRISIPTPSPDVSPDMTSAQKKLTLSSLSNSLSPSRKLLTAFKIKPSTNVAVPQVGVSQHETLLLQHLRMRLHPTGLLDSVDNDVLVRCLIARDWNVIAAHTLVRNYVTFLCPEVDPQSITATDVLSELQTGAICLTGGKDIHGASVLELIAWRYNSALHSTKKILETILFLIELTFETHKAAVRQGITLVVDTRGQSFGAFDYSSLRLVSTLQNRYPMKIQALHVIYDTRLVQLAVKWIKTTVSGIRGKIHMHAVPEGIHEMVFSHQLTENFGGTLAYDHETWINQQVRATKPKTQPNPLAVPFKYSTDNTAHDTHHVDADTPSHQSQQQRSFDDMTPVSNGPAGLLVRPRSKSFGSVPTSFINGNTTTSSTTPTEGDVRLGQKFGMAAQKLGEYLRSFAKRTAYLLKPTGTPLGTTHPDRSRTTRSDSFRTTRPRSRSARAPPMHL
eukprot:m.72560 g.72560  ORF g.72560 m.72560 type:complete len:642 (-) comp24464_c0_seq1:258-2183(-)